LEKYNCFKMPSTSPANARYSLDKLKEEWRMHIKRL
jgi:G:T/U-mismatch repair DNA glycosylase